MLGVHVIHLVHRLHAKTSKISLVKKSESIAFQGVASSNHIDKILCTIGLDKQTT